LEACVDGKTADGARFQLTDQANCHAWIHSRTERNGAICLNADIGQLLHGRGARAMLDRIEAAHATSIVR